MPVQCTCLTCGAPFEVAASLVRRGSGRYCSTGCYAESLRRPPEVFPCDHCGDPVLTRGRTRSRGYGYCSRACAAAATRRQTTLTCAYCGKTRSLRASRIAEGQRYCSHECHYFARQRRGTFECAYCGASRSITPSKLATGIRHCSLSCAYAARTGVCDPAEVAARFWGKVDHDGPMPDLAPELGQCWVWTGAPSADGYGNLRFHGRDRRAHVVAYILTVGHEPPPETPVITHRCDNGHLRCVRPSHLKADTAANNARHAWEIGRLTVPIHRKLNEEQVAEIRRLHAAGGVSMAALGRTYGITAKSVSMIVYRQTWANVD